MSSYLPERKTYVVCTNQLGSGHRKLLADPNRRKVSAFYQKKYPLLTTVDKKLDDDFTCKSSWSKGLNVGALGTGAGIGIGTSVAMMSAAASVSWIPFAGWIVGGALAITAVGYALYSALTAPKCSGALGHISSQWKLYHPSVYYNKHNALLSRSVLQCGEGGVLLPFLSINVAYKVSESIARNNKWDVGIGVVVSGLGGFGMAKLLLAGNISALGISLIIGNYIIPPSAEWAGNAYADVYRDQRYKEIEEAIGQKKEENKTYMDYIMASANPIDDTQTIIKNSNEIIANMKAHGASEEAIAEFEKSVAEAKRTGTFTNEKSSKVLVDIKEGKYGEKAQNIFKNKNGTTTGMHTEKSYDKAIREEQMKMGLNKVNSLKSFGNGSITILGIAQPFMSAIFNKRSILLAKEAQEKELEIENSNAISVVSSNY